MRMAGDDQAVVAAMLIFCFYNLSLVAGQAVPVLENEPQVCGSDWTELPAGSGNCFRYFENKLIWDGAEMSCVSGGGHLASFHFENVYQTVINFMQYIKGDIWFGLNDIANERETNKDGWEYTDGSNFDFQNWMSDNPKSQGDCVKINSNGEWEDKPCEESHSYVCKNIDECSDNTLICDTNAGCTNTLGSYNCGCNDGYTGDGLTCSDIDECSDNTHSCDNNAGCTNTPGSYNCDCSDGYTGDGWTCRAPTIIYDPQPLPSGQVYTKEETVGNSLLLTLTNQPLAVSCAMECADREGECVGYNYYKNTQTCDLMRTVNLQAAGAESGDGKAYHRRYVATP